MSARQSTGSGRNAASSDVASIRREAASAAANACARVPTKVADGHTPEADDQYRDADRSFHAAAASFTLGVSPISLLQALQDWALHLATSPGKQQELAAKAVEKFVRLATFVGGSWQVRE
jgi:hypothetical protein